MTVKAGDKLPDGKLMESTEFDSATHCAMGPKEVNVADAVKGKKIAIFGLPVGTKVAHTTGTLSRLVTNDAGVITLPGKAGRVVVTVQIKESTLALEAQEQAIAEVARAAYSHFTQTSQPRTQ